MGEYRYAFENLDVWKESREFVSQIYLETKDFPSEEKFGLCSQLQRAAVSIVSNIAEGIQRKSDKEKVRFLEIAYGSLMEVYCQLCIALDLQYFNQTKFNEHKDTIDKLANKLNALTRTINSKIKD